MPKSTLPKSQKSGQFLCLHKNSITRKKAKKGRFLKFGAPGRAIPYVDSLTSGPPCSQTAREGTRAEGPYLIVLLANLSDLRKKEARLEERQQQPREAAGIFCE
jgi:hypothetical protein